MPASLAAGSAVEKPILAKTYAELALAGAAIFLADALGLRHLALQADVGFRSSSAGAHTFDFISGHKQGKVPEVTRALNSLAARSERRPLTLLPP